MNMDQMTKWEALFGRRHAALALACLYVDGPMHWSDVGRSMARHGGDWFDSQTVTRALRALETQRLVEKTPDSENGNHHYALTKLGTDLAQRLKHAFGSSDPDQPDDLNMS